MPYPALPGRRMAYHADGTVVVDINADGTLTQLTAEQLATINDEDTADGYAWMGGAATTDRIAFIFPELRDLAGYFVAGTLQGGSLEVSADTTNGVDGTWTEIIDPYVVGGGPPAWRSSIQAIEPAQTGIIAVRFSESGFVGSITTIHHLHLYGDITAAETADRLRIWKAGSDAVHDPGEFDQGDIARASSADETFRVKNFSLTQTAETITVDVVTLTDKTPSMADDYLLSLDGITFTATVEIATLEPEEISAPITLRRVTPADAGLSVGAALIRAIAATWT